jgi:dUTP pyrophosphatase
MDTNTNTASDIVFEALHDGVLPPVRATEESAGYDLRAYVAGRTIKIFRHDNTTHEERVDAQLPAITLSPGDRALIPLGFKATLPHGYEAQVRPRSGTALKRALTIINTPGTIDADFPGEWAVLLWNASSTPETIQQGDAIAQMVLGKYEVLDFVNGQVGVTTERVGGYGSTGK